MATITRTASNTWKAVIRKRGWPATIKTFRTKRDAADRVAEYRDERLAAAKSASTVRPSISPDQAERGPIWAGHRR